MLRTVVKKLFSTALPLMSSRLAETLNTFILMVILAQFGHTVLAASLTIGMSRLVIMLLFMSPIFALGAVVGRQFGSGDHHHIPAILKEARILALTLSVFPMLIFVFIQPMLSALHQPPSILPVVGQFFHWFLWAMPAVYLISVNQQTLAAMGQKKLVLIFSAINLIICSSLNAGLGLGWLGLPKLEVMGTGLAQVIAYWIYFVISTYFTHRVMKNQHCLDKQCKHKPLFHWAKQIIKIGAPISLKFLSEMCLFFFIMIMTGWLGKLALAASQISMQYVSFVKVPLVGLGEACSIGISQAIGSKDKTFIQHMFAAPLIIGSGVIVVIGLIFLIFHKALLDIFIHSSNNNIQAETIYHIAIWLLVIRIVDMFCEMGNFMAVWTLRGMYDTQYPMWVSIILGWTVLVPLAAFFAFKLNWGVIGLTIGDTLGWGVIAVICLHRLKYKINHCATNQCN